MIGYIWTRESNVYDEEKYSLKSQLDACREAAKGDGIEVGKEHEYQVQFSGRDLRKIPELSQLRGILERNKDQRQRVYCYAQDRLIRGEEAEDIFYLLVEFRHFNAEVKFLKNPLDLSTIAGKIMALVAGHEASGEIEKIKERTMRGKLQRLKEGKLWGLGRDKFGYRKDRESGIAEISEPEAETVRRIFRESDEGNGLMAIARGLNKDGILTSFTARGEQKAQWWPTSVRGILRDPAYKGETVAFRYGGELFKMPDGLWPPIVNHALWSRVQEKLNTNLGERARNEKRPALLRGLIFCSACGARMYPDSQNGHKYYQCASKYLRRHKNENSPCAGKAVRADKIEAEVWEKFLWLINNPDHLIQNLDLARTVNVVESLESRLNVIRLQIREKGIEQERLVRRLRRAEGRVAVLVESEIRQLESERSSLQASATEIECQLAEQRAGAVDVGQIHQICQDLAAADNSTFEQRRNALEKLRVAIITSGLDWGIVSWGVLSSSK